MKLVFTGSRGRVQFRSRGPDDVSLPRVLYTLAQTLAQTFSASAAVSSSGSQITGSYTQTEAGLGEVGLLKKAVEYRRL